MSSRLTLVILAILMASLIVTGCSELGQTTTTTSTTTTTYNYEYMPGEAIIKFAGDVTVDTSNITTNSSSINALLEKYEVSKIRESPLENVYLIYFPEEKDVLAVVADFENNDRVVRATPNYIVHIF